MRCTGRAGPQRTEAAHLISAAQLTRIHWVKGVRRAFAMRRDNLWASC